MSGFRETLHFALRNRKLVFGLSMRLALLLFAIVGPYLAQHRPYEYGELSTGADASSTATGSGRRCWARTSSRSSSTGLRLAFIVGAIGGGIAALDRHGHRLHGRLSRRRGRRGPEHAHERRPRHPRPSRVLLVIAAYLQVRGIVRRRVLIGLTSWPWAARAIRAQTFSLVSRDFVDLARLCGRAQLADHLPEIAPNMSSYLLHDVHPALRRLDPDRRDARLHRARPVERRSRSGR